MSPALIFDLDDTLLDTSVLREARDRREWGTVLGGLDAVSQFEVADGEPAVVELPREAKRRGLATGLLTHSPRNYAEALLDRHGIRVDEMVTGSDGFPTKPDPAGLLAVARALGMQPEDCACVGDAVGDFGAAAAAGMMSIGVSWDGHTPLSWRHAWPDVAVDRPSRLLELIDGAEELGPVGELVADGKGFEPHWGSTLRLGRSVYGLGRYFPMGDRRYQGHRLSHLIIDAKNDPAARVGLGDVFGALAAALQNPPGLVVAVPPSPGEEDRFAAARSALATPLGAEDGAGVLEQLYGVPDYKQTRREDRAAKVVDRFRTTRSLAGESVVVLDDIYTSGAQSEACRKALLEAGAGTVAVFVAGVTQDTLPDPCPVCGEEWGGTIKTKRRRRDGKEFYGCSRWPNCRWSADI